jgi:hypothetical protein
MKLEIGIHDGDVNGYSARWAEAVRSHGGEVRRLDLLGADPLGQVEGCDGVMWYWAHYPHGERLAALPILRVIEQHLHIPIFPDMATCWHYDDKVAQSYLLKAIGIPHPKTWVFFREADALAWCEMADYPVVAKLSGGAGGTNVHRIHGVSEAKSYIGQCFSGSGIVLRPPWPSSKLRRPLSWMKRGLLRAAQAVPYVCGSRFPSFPDQTYWMPQKNYVLFQEFVAGNEFDTRVTVIGNRAFAFRRMNRPDDFRASGSGQIDYDSAAIDPSCLRVAFDAARKLKSQSVAFDFLFRGEAKEPVVGEISYRYADWAVEKCSGHWNPDLNWCEGHLWPQDAQIEDFLIHIQEGARVGR